MSGNIHDTNVSKMRVLINDFINELEETIEKGDDIVEYEDIYKEKYSYIIKTSENLYKMIYDQYKMSFFDKMINLKLNPDRVDVIVTAGKIYQFVLDKMNVEKITVPKIGLADGMVHELMKKL